ncbi:MAG: hypothetical protein ACI8Z9_002107 [Paraglaciecola sp.]|jgi:hypothetical protein
MFIRKTVHSIIRRLLLLSLLSLSYSANAVYIEYELNLVNGNTYQYDYTIFNDDIAAGIEEFAIFFEVFATKNLAVVAKPVGWDFFLALPDPLLPDNGFADFYINLASPIAFTANLGGFSVQFDWLGASRGPGAQAFKVYDANFDIVASGSTTSSVPEPATLAMILIGLLLIKRKVAYSTNPTT